MKFESSLQIQIVLPGVRVSSVQIRNIGLGKSAYFCKDLSESLESWVESGKYQNFFQFWVKLNWKMWNGCLLRLRLNNTHKKKVKRRGRRIFWYSAAYEKVQFFQCINLAEFKKSNLATLIANTERQRVLGGKHL